MPFYHAIVKPGSADEAQRAAFANDVVDIHCDITGAPRSFVHVMFTEDADRVPDGRVGVVRGTIRSGRNADQKADLANRLRAALAARTGLDESTLEVTTTDIEASFTMEGGELLPEPGSPEEEVWKSHDERAAVAD